MALRRDCRLLSETYEGTNEIQRLVFARALK
jgi:alkylation response protein AidB-like acyl-CoA dehydrogenase